MKSKRSSVALITDTDQVAPGQPFTAALRLQLAPGWHTYWQNPGDAGMPPSLTPQLSPGSEAGPIQWPVPQRLAEGTLTTHAYTGDVVLPFVVSPGSGAFSMHAHADWLVCKDICVPEEAELDLQLPQGVPAPSAQAAEIRSALARVPADAPFRATIDPEGVLDLHGPGLPSGVRSAEFFPMAVGATGRAATAVAADGRGGIEVHLPTTLNTVFQGVIALTAASGAVSAYHISPQPIPGVTPAPLLSMLLLAAVAGGLLLNLMPCVFPILAMKAMALARLSGADLRRVRGQAVSYSAGVLVAFLALGTVLVAARAAGQASGWGFQFQSPLFVTCVAWLLFAIGLNLSGVFTVGEGLMGRGSTGVRRPGHAGSFLTGILAVVVASPCSAPFMGTALAGALALSVPWALSVFLALGVGLALPYGVLACIPAAAGLLPRPGAWMRTLQQMLAFPMYAAAVWLAWVLSQQAGPNGVLVACGGALAVAVAAWLLGFVQQDTGFGRNAARGGLVSIGMVLAGLLYVVQAGTGSAGPAEPFSTARLEALRSAGQPVFVNMTAAWCLSCLVNEEVALARPAVREAFARTHVVYMKGDWTSRNPAISAFLQQLGQDGVPLYVLFAPGRPPQILPQILSEGSVLAALAAVRG